MVKVKKGDFKMSANSITLQVLKGCIISTTISLVLILLFALLIRFVNISEKIIMPINQAIKIVSIFVGCLFSLNNSNKGFIKGALIGLSYAILSYVIFSFLSGNLSIAITSLTDMLFCVAIGGISGILAVNIRKK